MYTRKRTGVIALLVLAAMLLSACGGGSTEAEVGVVEKPPQEFVEVEEGVAEAAGLDTEVPAPTEVAVAEPEVEPDDSVCQVAKWQIIPREVFQFPLGDGWKAFVVFFAIHNGSGLWGKVDLIANSLQISVTTEGSFEYGLEVNPIQIPENTKLPYSGEWLGPSGYLIETPYLPPGFTVGGTSRQYRCSFQPCPFYLVFKVAESQQQLTLNFSLSEGGTGRVKCLSPNGVEVEERLLPFTYPLYDVAEVSFPTDSDFPDLFITTIESQDQGTVHFYEAAQDFDDYDGYIESSLYLNFNAINPSEGYGIQGSVADDEIYLVDRNGYISTCVTRMGPRLCAVFSAGPGQYGKGTVELYVPADSRHFKFVWFNPNQLIYEILDLDLP